MRPVVLKPPVLGQEASNLVRSYVFNSNLASQEQLGVHHASTSVEQVIQRLQGSSESAAYLLALIDSALTPFIAPMGVDGFESLPSTISAGDSDADLEAAGFAFITVPKNEDQNLIETELVLDAGYQPLPGEDYDASALSVIAQLSHAVERFKDNLGRTKVAVYCAVNPGPDYHLAATIAQCTVDVADLCNLEDDCSQRGRVLHGYVGGDDILELLRQSSTDSFHGDLELDPVNWNQARLQHADARAQQRGQERLSVTIDDDEGSAVGLIDFYRHRRADPTAVEIGVIVVDRKRRRQGIGTRLINSGLHRLTEIWPETKVLYFSHTQGDARVEGLLRPLNPRVLGTQPVWLHELK